LKIYLSDEMLQPIIPRNAAGQFQSEIASKNRNGGLLTNNPITTSVFELFKAGPGPSSSHTIGPLLAGLDFRNLLQALPEEDKKRAGALRVRLLGSLSATGRGHGTDKAVLTGLMGYSPNMCPDFLPAGVLELPPEDRRIDLGGPFAPLIPDENTVIFNGLEHEYPFNNTMIFSLLDIAGKPVLERIYYSVGGGFIQWEGWSAPERGSPPHPFACALELRALAEEKNLSLPQIILDNEAALTGRSPAEIFTELDTGRADAPLRRQGHTRGRTAAGQTQDLSQSRASGPSRGLHG
jgi:L-serine dehydratase